MTEARKKEAQTARAANRLRLASQAVDEARVKLAKATAYRNKVREAVEQDGKAAVELRAAAKRRQAGRKAQLGSKTKGRRYTSPRQLKPVRQLSDRHLRRLAAGEGSRAKAARAELTRRG